MKHLSNRSLHFLKDIALKKVIKQFAKRYNFVYFGHVDPHEDEHELVRGATLSTSHTDHHYTVGSYLHHDIVLVRRSNILTYPGKEPVHHSWLIMQFDLGTEKLPHIFLDSRRHDQIFYANMLLALPRFEDISAFFAQTDPEFAKHFRVFADSNQHQRVNDVLKPEIIATLGRHFYQFDYEIFEDKLQLYASNTVPTPILLNDMLRIGAWLADELRPGSNSPG